MKLIDDSWEGDKHGGKVAGIGERGGDIKVKDGFGRVKPCFAWAKRGKCLKGDTCAYAHDMATRGKGLKRKGPSGQQPSGSRPKKPFDRSKVPCRFFSKGKCREGSKCAYLHDGEGGTSKQWANMTAEKTAKRTVKLIEDGKRDDSEPAASVSSPRR